MDFIGTKRKMETWTGANENVFVVPDNARCLFPLRQPPANTDRARQWPGFCGGPFPFFMTGKRKDELV
jgi:hypothetical protein